LKVAKLEATMVPFGAYFFEVEINGNVYPFRSCSGLKMETAVVEIEEGGFNHTTRKLVGRTKYPNIVLKKGFVGADSELYRLKRKMMDDGAAGTPQKPGFQAPNRITGTITQKGPDGNEAKWMFSGGWICKWEGPDLDAGKNEVSVETVEIAHEGLMMLGSAKGGGGGSGASGSGGSGGSSGSSPAGDSGSSSSGDSGSSSGTG
jgi:phage tail-like protein